MVNSVYAGSSPSTLEPTLGSDSVIGKRVTLKNLTQVSLNGQNGTVVSYNTETQRYIINLETPEPKTIAIKKEKFEISEAARSNSSPQLCISTCLNNQKLAEMLKEKLNASKNKIYHKEVDVENLISYINLEEDPYIFLHPNNFDDLIDIYSNAWQIKRDEQDLILLLKCMKIECYPQPSTSCRFQTKDIGDIFSDCGLEHITQSKDGSTISFPGTPYNRQIVDYLSTIIPAFSQLSFDDGNANLTCNLNLIKQVDRFHVEIKQWVLGQLFKDMISKFFPGTSTDYLKHIEVEGGYRDSITIKGFHWEGRNKLQEMFNENPSCVGISIYDYSQAKSIHCSQKFMKMGFIVAQIRTGSISQTDDENQTVLLMLEDKISQLSEQTSGLQISSSSIYAVHDWFVVKMPEASLTKNQSEEINNKLHLKHVCCDGSGYVFIEKKQITDFQKEQIAIKEKFEKRLEEQKNLGIESQAKKLYDLKTIIVTGNRFLAGIYPLSKSYLKKVMPPSEYKQFKGMADNFDFQKFKEVGFLLESLKEFKNDILKLNDCEAKRRIESYETFLTDMLKDFCPTHPSEISETSRSVEELNTLLAESGLKGYQVNEIHLLGGASSSESYNRTMKIPATAENTIMLKELSRRCSSCYYLEPIEGNYSFTEVKLAKLQSQLKEITEEDRLQLVSDAQNKISLSRFENICDNLGVQINKSELTITKDYGSTIKIRGLSPDSFSQLKSKLSEIPLAISYPRNNEVEIRETLLNFIEFATNPHPQRLYLDQRDRETLNLTLKLVYKNVAEHLKSWDSFQNLEKNDIISIHAFDQSIVIKMNKITAIKALKKAFDDSYLKECQCINFQDKTYIIMSKQEVERIGSVIDNLDRVDVQSLHDKLKPPKEEFEFDSDACRQILNKNFEQISHREKLNLFGFNNGQPISREVKSRFQKLALTFHPDKDKTADSQELKTKRFQNLQMVYAILDRS